TVTMQVTGDKLSIQSDLLDYTCRPIDQNFCQMSLWEFVEWTCKEIIEFYFPASGSLDLSHDGHKKRSYTHRPRGNFSLGEHPQFTTHRLRLRTKPVIPVLIGDSVPNRDGSQEDKEAFC
ncbi:hypothetical protein PAXRUDRAFT_168536, partial [Paxillus rubicundulus Ve08.2h10]